MIRTKLCTMRVWLVSLFVSFSLSHFTLYKLTEAISTFNARSLDGSPSAIYFEEGPTGSNDWVLFFQGGGWCYNLAD